MDKFKLPMKSESAIGRLPNCEKCGAPTFVQQRRHEAGTHLGIPVVTFSTNLICSNWVECDWQQEVISAEPQLRD